MRCAPSTLAKWRLTGTGPRYSKYGRIVVYDRADVERFVEAQKRRSTSESTLS
jgi:hypothetical protein